jgi:hypothetical protein
MSFRDVVKKYQNIVNARNYKVTMIWVDSIEHLGPTELESKNDIYLYLEI